MSAPSSKTVKEIPEGSYKGFGGHRLTVLELGNTSDDEGKADHTSIGRWNDVMEESGIDVYFKAVGVRRCIEGTLDSVKAGTSLKRLGTCCLRLTF